VTISALPALVGPVTNLRNTILIQSALKDVLDVQPQRGVIKFVPVAEENLATNSMTAMAEIEQLERSSQDESSSVIKSLSRTMSRKINSNSSRGTTSRFPHPQQPPQPTSESNIPSTKPDDGVSTIAVLERNPPQAKVTEKSRVLRKCKSLRQLFSRKGPGPAEE
jgi:hypothetical protein